jgi:predicted DCC family thiol-disulfide oxidoreductase YuxK
VVIPAAASVLYDRDCGFCRWCVGWVLRFDSRRRLRPVALQKDLATELLPGLGPEQRMDSWHLVGADRAVLSGGAAMPALAAFLWPGFGPRLGRLISPFAEPGYRMVADHRSGLGKLVSAGALARADRLIAGRSEPLG